MSYSLPFYHLYGESLEITMPYKFRINKGYTIRMVIISLQCKLIICTKYSVIAYIYIVSEVLHVVLGR